MLWLRLKKLREIFKKNSYLSRIIDQSINSFLKKTLGSKKSQFIPTVPKKELSIILPYMETISSSLKWKLRTFFKNLLPQCNIKLILKSENRLSYLIRFKTVIPKQLQSHIVYTFTCGNCDITYHGKTESHFNVRYSERLSTSNLTVKREKCKSSGVSNCPLLHNHDSGFNILIIICQDNNGFRRLLLENILILGYSCP